MYVCELPVLGITRNKLICYNSSKLPENNYLARPFKAEQHPSEPQKNCFGKLTAKTSKQAKQKLHTLP